MFPLMRRHLSYQCHFLTADGMDYYISWQSWTYKRDTTILAGNLGLIREILLY